MLVRPEYSHNLAECYAEARRILRHHGKSYYFATRCFPPELQKSTCALYAFVRLPDEIVDNEPQSTPAELARIREKLETWKCDWQRAYDEGGSNHPILHIAALTFHQHKIPLEYSTAFVDAMIQDTHVARYETFTDLQQYMYGSAACVGLMMSHIIGFSDAVALKHATQLGEAMQLSNFLRDIEEDYFLRNRVYLPQDELREYSLCDDDIANKNFSPNFQRFMRFQIERASTLYDQANAGIAYLKPEGRFAVMAASTLYRAILLKLEKQNCNPFAGRAATNKAEKVLLAFKARQATRRLPDYYLKESL
jgi:phytoene synthase